MTFGMPFGPVRSCILVLVMIGLAVCTHGRRVRQVYQDIPDDVAQPAPLLPDASTPASFVPSLGDPTGGSSSPGTQLGDGTWLPDQPSYPSSPAQPSPVNADGADARGPGVLKDADAPTWGTWGGPGPETDATKDSLTAEGSRTTCPAWDDDGQGLTVADRNGPGNPHVFSELTLQETVAIAIFLLSQRSLNLTDQASIPLRGPEHLRVNFIHGMWYQIPNKTEVLTHLDQRGPLPRRRARVVLVMAAVQPPQVREVLVVLPRPNSMTPALIHSTNRFSLSLWQRPRGPLDELGWKLALRRFKAGMDLLLREAFDNHTLAYQGGCQGGNRCLEVRSGMVQYLSEQHPRAVYLSLVKVVEDEGGSYSLPLPFQCLALASGQALTAWTLGSVWFNFRWYDSLPSLVAAWKDPSTGLKPRWRWRWPSSTDAGSASFKLRPGPKRGSTQPMGPVSYEPYGRRFKVIQGDKLEWLGWSLAVGLLPTSGPRLWDVRFKGRRIAYEISMQEALANYGGGDLAQANSLILGSHWGMGSSYRELLHGLDCPVNSAYMNAVSWWGGEARARNAKNVICVFEMDNGLPAMNVYRASSSSYGGFKSWVLVIRSVAVLLTTEYILDTLLYVDGTLETRVHLSGIPQAAPHNSSTYPGSFGYPLAWKAMGGTLHHHHLAWKVDLDINGTSNTVQLHGIKADAKVDTGMGARRSSYYYEVADCEMEGQPNCALLGNGPGGGASQQVPVVVNERAKNRMGVAKGYKVQVNRPAEELLPEDDPYKKSLGFAQYSFLTTRRKDEESTSSSPYSQPWLANPVVRLDSYLDREDLREQDLVLWVSSGVYRIPTAEDAPGVATTGGGRSMGFTLSPFNYGEESQATDMADLTWVQGGVEALPLVQAAGRCQPAYGKVPWGDTGG